MNPNLKKNIMDQATMTLGHSLSEILRILFSFCTLFLYLSHNYNINISLLQGVSDLEITYNLFMKLKNLSAVGLGTLLLVASSFLSKALGVLRDHTFANIFGTGLLGEKYNLDAYFAAFRIPDLIYMLLIYGALSAALIPIYTKISGRNTEEADAFASQVLNLLLFALIFVLVAAYFLMPWIFPFIAPGFDAASIATSVDLSRIMLLSPLFLAISSVLQGVENSKKLFWGVSLAPILYNLAIILSAIFFGKTYGVYALAYGVVVAAILHFAIQIPFAFHSGFKYRAVLFRKNKNLKNFFNLSVSRVLGGAVIQVGFLIDTIIATLIGLGALSVYNYAFNLQSLPYAVVGVSFSLAVFSTLAQKSEEKKEFALIVKNSIYNVLFWVLPSVVGVYMLRAELVDFFLRGGAFGAEDALLTSATLGVFIWAALFQSLIPLLARSFYALEDSRTPLFLSFFAVLIGALASYFFALKLNYGIVALAYSAILSSSFYALCLLIFLARKIKIPVFNLLGFKNNFFITFASLVMGMGIWFVQETLGRNYGSFVILIVSAFVAAGLYFAVHGITKTFPSLLKDQ